MPIVSAQGSTQGTAAGSAQGTTPAAITQESTPSTPAGSAQGATPTVATQGSTPGTASGTPSNAALAAPVFMFPPGTIFTPGVCGQIPNSLPTEERGLNIFMGSLGQIAWLARALCMCCGAQSCFSRLAADGVYCLHRCEWCSAHGHPPNARSRQQCRWEWQQPSPSNRPKSCPWIWHC